MKLKYYLRGLGIGIIVTALLMGVAMKDNGAMTDEEIKARAVELGMVEQRTLADIRDNMETEPVATEVPESKEEPIVTKEPVTAEVPVAEPTEEPQATEAPVIEPTEEPQATEEPMVTEEPEVEPTEEPQATEEPQESSQPTEEPVERVTIKIERGDSSEAVSRKLAKAGLIESASKFNQYLLDNNLAKVIYVGTYEIEMGSSMKEIAKIITN